MHVSFKIVSIALLGLLLTGCANRNPFMVSDQSEAETRLRDQYAAGGVPTLSTTLDADIDLFQRQMEQGLTRRAELITLARQAHARIAANLPLGPDLHDALTQSMAEMLAEAGGIFRSAVNHEPWMRAQGKHGLPDLPDDLRIKAGLLSCAGSLFLFDTYLATGAVLADNDHVRQVLNQGDLGYGVGKDQLEAVTEAYHSVFQRAEIRARLAALERNQSQIQALAAVDSRAAWLTEAIAQSPSRERLKVAPFSVMSSSVVTTSASVTDDLKALGDNSVGSMSMIFGNAVGLVETRKGRLYGNTVLAADLRARLRPGDILLEKTPFRLTDRFIPGHWGHAAIWVGDINALTPLGLAEDPLVVAQKDSLANSHCVCEALRDGVQLNTIEHFMNIDDCAILRQVDASPQRTNERIRLALRQLGKPYDFNFDVDSTDRIVCSELIYVTYTDIAWPTTRAFGRHTISPDQVAMRALGGGPLTVVALWHDGREEPDPVAAMARLVTMEEPAGK